MAKSAIAFAALIGLAGASLLTGRAQAMSQGECDRLSANQFLASIERGDCSVDIQTAAGPTAGAPSIPGEEPGDEPGGGEERTARGEGGNPGGGGGGGDDGGSGGESGGSPGRSTAASTDTP